MEQRSERNLVLRQKLAIETADKIAELILSSRPDIESAIIGRRRANETCASIAKNEAQNLKILGATSHEVRRAIVTRVCSQRLDEGKRHEIISAVHLGLPSNLANLDEVNQRKGIEARMMFQWTPEIDRALVQFAKTELRVIGAYTGKPDWKMVSQKMKIQFNIVLKPDQWRHRALHTLKLKEKTQDGAE